MRPILRDIAWVPHLTLKNWSLGMHQAPEEMKKNPKLVEEVWAAWAGLMSYLMVNH